LEAFLFLLFFLFLLISASVVYQLCSSTSYASSDEKQEEESKNNENNKIQIDTLFTGLEYPTGMAFLGPDDILVLEKDKGTVQRIVNGVMLDEPILSFNVVNEREKYGYEERGLLGIAVSKNSSSDKTYVFLYYTEAEEDSGRAIGNRLYRYELSKDGTKLVNPKLLLELPVEQDNPSHNGGVLAIGPDKNVYVVVGNLIGPWDAKGPEDSQAVNVIDGKEPDGRAGILRVTQDGAIVDGRGILGDEHPLDMYYAYGIRNSFGIGFDPVTGNLWDTENGGAYDEINRIEPGFNSGWNKVTGKASMEEGFDIEKDLILFNGKGKYSDPEFSWKGGTVPTAVVFFHSDKLGKQYENDMFIGSASGNIYHFKLAGDARAELALDGELADKIAESPDEVENVIFASGLKTITDLEIGPDGYLYGTSYDKDGSVFKIMPSVE
jgi:glucose/arabinose dehydrogenase